MKTNYFGSHFEDQVSSVPAATPPTTAGEASRIPGESTLGSLKLYYLFCDIFNFIVSVEAIIKPIAYNVCSFLDPIHGHTGTIGSGESQYAVDPCLFSGFIPHS